MEFFCFFPVWFVFFFRYIMVGLRPLDPSGSWGIIIVVNGYLLHDFFATRKEWIKYPDQCIHHIAGLGICSALVFAQPQVQSWFYPFSSLP